MLRYKKKFVHAADVHLGTYRDEKLSKLVRNNFNFLIDFVKNEADFLIISGDLFNSSIPSIDDLKLVAKRFKELHHIGKKVFLISGSHDFSPTGKTMLSVLEEAGLCKNVEMFHDGKLAPYIDEKNQLVITGVGGRMAMTDSQYYYNLNINLDLNQYDSYIKIFCFHNAIEELMQSKLKINTIPISIIPKGFDYYAGGHIHEVSKIEEGKGTYIYPGPIFPNNFTELDLLKEGTFYFYNSKDLIKISIPSKKVLSIKIKGNFSPQEFENQIYDNLMKLDLNDSIILIKLSGVLPKTKNITEIDFKKINEYIYSKGAYFVMKNTNNLIKEEFKNISIEHKNEIDMQKDLIKEHIDKFPFKIKNPEKFIEDTLDTFFLEKDSGETLKTYEDRLFSNLDKLFEEIDL